MPSSARSFRTNDEHPPRTPSAVELGMEWVELISHLKLNITSTSSSRSSSRTSWLNQMNSKRQSIYKEVEQTLLPSCSNLCVTVKINWPKFIHRFVTITFYSFYYLAKKNKLSKLFYLSAVIYSISSYCLFTNL